MAKAVRVTRTQNGPEVKCEMGCNPALIGSGRTTAYDMRVAVRFHVRETGHPVTVTVVDEARYEPGDVPRL